MRPLFKNLRLWEVHALSHSESLSEKRKNMEEQFPRHIRNHSVSEILSVDPPIFRQYLPALALY